jgi:hypothetical protein
MRSRTSLILIALTMLFAFVATGCGDDNSTSDGAAPAGATQSADPGSTGGSGAATASAQENRDKCLQAASAVADADKAAEAKEACEEAYDQLSEATKKIDQKTSDARAQCEEAANNIPNEEAKANALAACAKFK